MLPMNYFKKNFGPVPCLCCILLINMVAFVFANPAHSLTSQGKRESLQAVRIPFISNRGQKSNEAKFHAKTFAGTVFVTRKGEIVYSLVQHPQRFSETAPHITTVNRLVLKEVFLNSLPTDIQGIDPSKTRISSFIGKSRAKWKSNIATFDGVSMGEIYPGIKLSLKASGNNVEKLFYISPGADPESIRIRFEGTDSLAINKSGELVATTDSLRAGFTAPIAFQQIRGDDGSLLKKYVTVSYHTRGNEYGFHVGDYDRRRELVIDPLLASTFIGGAAGDNGTALTIADDGSVYIAGYTYSDDFPVTTGAYSESTAGNQDIFISHLSADLTTLYESTYLGGSDAEYLPSLAIAQDQTILVAGVTRSTDFPVTSGAYNENNNGANDIFISHLSADLSTLLQSTYYGGSSSEQSPSLLSGADNTLYVGGTTSSADLPVTSSSYDKSFNGGSDMFISHFSSDLSSLTHATFLGGFGTEYTPTLKFSATDDTLYAAGVTDSPDFPVTAGAYSETLAGSEDVYISHLSADLSTLQESTLLGGSDYEYATSLSIAPDNSLYVATHTRSADFPVTTGAYDTSYNGQYDICISLLSADLSTLSSSTYLGGSLDETFPKLSLAVDGSLYVTGQTYSSDFPVTSDAYHISSTPAFISHLTANLNLLSHSTFFNAAPETIQMASNGSVYLAGTTSGYNFPTTPGAYDESRNGSNDSFITIIDPALSAEFPPHTVTPSVSAGGSLVPATAQIIEHNSVTTFEVTPDDGYSIDTVTGCDGGMFTANSYVTGNIIDDCTVTATFRKKMFWPLFIQIFTAKR